MGQEGSKGQVERSKEKREWLNSRQSAVNNKQ